MIRSSLVGRAEVGEKGAYVMSAATRVWKNRATEQRAEERKLPMREQRARTPRNMEQTAKKRAMSTKANMKRVR